MIRLIPIISVSLLLLVILGGVFLLKPQYEDLKGLKLELEITTIDLEQKKAYYSKLNEINEELEKHKADIAQIDSALPIDPSIPALFYFIQVTASENGLVLGNIKEGTMTQGEQFRDIPLSVSLLGSYNALKNFLNAIYKNSRMIEVTSISFSSPAKGGDFTFALELKTHSFKQ
jgi:type IV pilus assembly protein PilO